MLGPGRKPAPRRDPALEPDLAAALAAVEAGESNCDAVAAASGLSGAAAAAALARLELLGYVNSSILGTYVRTLGSASTGTTL